jgi:hypothetical protein
MSSNDHDELFVMVKNCWMYLHDWIQQKHKNYELLLMLTMAGQDLESALVSIQYLCKYLASVPATNYYWIMVHIIFTRCLPVVSGE